MKYSKYICLLLLIVAFGCNQNYSKKVKATLKSAGRNKKELLKALKHYENDSLKYDALLFLIENMNNKNGVSYQLTNFFGKPVDYKPEKYVSWGNARKALDSIEDNHYYFVKTKEDNIPDVKVISANYLINTVDLAFDCWLNKPWAKHVNYSDFKEYILPYRARNEKLTNWRPKLMKMYDSILIENNLKSCHDPVQVCKLINDHLADWITYGPGFSIIKNIQSVDNILDTKKGTCMDLTIMAACTMRSVGLPISIDFTPFWADRGFGHSWNSVIDTTGNSVHFNAIDKNCPPGNYPINAKIAKVFRLPFSNNSESLAVKTKNLNKIPETFRIPNMIDITPIYTNVSNITLTNYTLPSQKAETAYLSVFNRNKWKPIYWGFIKNNKILFNNMGIDVLYLPVVYHKNKKVPIADPLILRKDSSITFLKANTAVKIDLVLTHYYDEIVGIRTKKEIIPGSYSLYYWDDNWVFVNNCKTASNNITFTMVPSNGLYKIVAENHNYDFIRVFTYENNEQVWW